MTEKREELIRLIEALPDDQVDVLLAKVRHLASRPKGIWPPEFVGMIKDGPTGGSSPDYVDGALSGGFGNER